MTTPDPIIPLPMGEALAHFPQEYRENVLRYHRQWFPEGDLVFPVKHDDSSPSGEYFAVLVLRHDDSPTGANEDDPEPWRVLDVCLFWGGGADGDSVSFATREEAITYAAKRICEGGWNLAPRQHDP